MFRPLFGGGSLGGTTSEADASAAVAFEAVAVSSRRTGNRNRQRSPCLNHENVPAVPTFQGLAISCLQRCPAGLESRDGHPEG